MNTIIRILMSMMVMFTITSCMSEEQKEAKRAEIYYLNEDFVLVDKTEETASSDGTPFKVRTWKLHRINSPYDSVYVGEITSRVLDTEPTDNCGCGDFYITNELWYNKEVGDVLHFEFIRKNRFYKVAKVKLETQSNNDGLVYASDYESTTSPQSVSTTTSINNLETERRILEIEREILALERELELLKEQ